MLFLFENYTLDTDRRELRRDAVAVPVEPQVFDLLTYLIKNRDRVASKDDLVTAIWGGRIVSESALTTRINAARCAIGDSGAEQRLIKTLARKGLRFVGAVREETETVTAVGTGDATASHANLAAGLIRSEELIAGEIDHVLFGTVACCNGQTVGASKTYGGICDTMCTGNQGGALGQVYMLDMTDAEIDALGKSPSGTAVLKAMAHYGIMDGDENAWGFLLNAVTPSFSRTSVGGVDPIVAWAQAQGLPSDGNGGYALDYGSGIDWATKLVALAPP